jgi:hypothetical protein
MRPDGDLPRRCSGTLPGVWGVSPDPLFSPLNGGKGGDINSDETTPGQ